MNKHLTITTSKGSKDPATCVYDVLALRDLMSFDDNIKLLRNNLTAYDCLVKSNI